METILTVFGVAVISGVLAFATLMVNKLWEQIKWYQDKLLPAVENNTVTVGELKKYVEKELEGLR